VDWVFYSVQTEEEGRRRKMTKIASFLPYPGYCIDFDSKETTEWFGKLPVPTPLCSEVEEMIESDVVRRSEMLKDGSKIEHEDDLKTISFVLEAVALDIIRQQHQRILESHRTGSGFVVTVLEGFRSRGIPRISINSYINRLIKYLECPWEVVVYVIVYIYRLYQKNIPFDQYTIRRILLSWYVWIAKRERERKNRKSFLCFFGFF
jgi:hypothetical protein